MQKEIEITIAPEHVADEQIIRQYLSKALKVGISSIHHHQILKRSIDARARKVIYRLQVRAYIDEQPSMEENKFS